MGRNKSKNKGLIIVLSAIALVGAASGIALIAPKAGADAPAAQPEQQAMPVAVEVAEKKPHQIWTEYPGRLVAVDYVEVRPQVSGEIKEIKFTDGQAVKAGDVLLIIDPRRYEAAVSRAEADLAAAKSEFVLAEKELGRVQNLVETGAVARRVYDERVSNQKVAQNAIKAAEAALKQAKVDTDYAYVKAPIDGRVSRAEITVGNLVEAGPGAPVLTSIVSDKGIYADFEVDEQTYLSHIRGNTKTIEGEQAIPVRLTLQNGGEKEYTGTIRSFDNRINPASGSIRARAFLPNTDGSLLPGMFARVKLGNSSMQPLVVLPARAIGTDQDRKFVYVVGDDNMVAYRAVTLGPSLDTGRVILTGLEGGEKIIVDGIQKVRPGMPVVPQAKEEQAKADSESPPEAALPAAGADTPPESPKE